MMKIIELSMIKQCEILKLFNAKKFSCGTLFKGDWILSCYINDKIGITKKYSDVVERTYTYLINENELLQFDNIQKDKPKEIWELSPTKERMNKPISKKERYFIEMGYTRV